jgi:hypothetical protein
VAAPKVKPGGKDRPVAVSGRTSVEVMAGVLLVVRGDVRACVDGPLQGPATSL